MDSNRGSEKEMGLRVENIRGLILGQQMIHVALPVGVLIFAGVIAYLFFGMEPGGSTDDMEIVRLLSYCHFGLFFFTWTIALLFLDRIFLSPKAVGRAMETLPPSSSGGMDGPTMGVLKVLNTTCIIRLALMEGPALMGLVVCMLGVLGGGIINEPIYLLNAVSTLLFVIYAALSFPSTRWITNRVEELLRRQQ